MCSGVAPNRQLSNLQPFSKTGNRIVAFYVIVNIPRDLLPKVFREMWQVLHPGGQLVLSFHIGDETIHSAEFLGQLISMDFFPFNLPRSKTHRGCWTHS